MSKYHPLTEKIDKSDTFYDSLSRNNADQIIRQWLEERRPILSTHFSNRAINDILELTEEQTLKDKMISEWRQTQDWNMISKIAEQHFKEE